jgi:hypothetical protein
MILASGLHATVMPRQKQFEIMLAMGWDVAPKILCRGCACPMDHWRMRKAQEIYHEGIGGILVKGFRIPAKENTPLMLYKQQTKESFPGLEDKVEKWFKTIGKE